MRSLLSLALAVLLTQATVAFAAVVSGTIESVDQAAHSVSIKTKDGATNAFQVTKETVVHGVDATEQAGRLAALDAKKGAHAVVTYSETDGGKAAHSVKLVGQEGLESTHGTVESFDEIHYIALKVRESGRSAAQGEYRVALTQRVRPNE